MIYHSSRLKNIMQEHDVEMVIAATAQNIKYFSGFMPVVKTLRPYQGECYVMITAGNVRQIHLVHAIGEIDQVLDSPSDIGLVHTYGTFFREPNDEVTLTDEERRLQSYSDLNTAFADAETALLQAVAALISPETRRVGIDEDGLHAMTFLALQRAFPAIRFVPFSAQLRRTRQVKTPFEIEQLSTSAINNENAVRHVCEYLHAGMQETEIVRRFNMSLAGDGSIPTLTMLKIGRHAVGGQRLPRAENRLRRGDVLWFDADASYQGFWSDIARTVIFDHDNQEYREKYGALKQGMDIALQQIEPGMTGQEVFHLVMDKINRCDLFHYRRHHVGHGIGLEPYELPLLGPNDKTPIEEGMVLSVETPYYQFGTGALHLESPLLVTRQNNICLTREWAPEWTVIKGMSL
ncbi:aminopeptidase P family protein [Dickeya dadantii]|uniref:M24 family metallopeptidase n=1 Tax=Dickeya dadantii TaxID=204038 RepID=UPI0013735209|nr:Xaa-Pro peptidase family protein [Dickeya dadantii]NAT79273.1 aminopeptidase P family protein [Dickeya dadantii]NPE64016.1 aminopeptidase P family protein [Dickeya dadantii]